MKHKTHYRQGGYYRPKVYVEGRQVLVSRLTMERHLCRTLGSEEIVHHINGNPKDNRLSNLQIVTRAEHKSIHSDIGVATRLKKIWHLNPAQLRDRFQTQTAQKIAASIGCSEKTVSRALRTLPEYKQTLPRGKKPQLS